MSDVLRVIKDRINTREALEHYGVTFNKKGFAKCPFHVEKTASLSIKNGRYKCFGCGESGSVIDFVMNYFNLSIKQALVKLDDDFKLNLIKKDLPKREKIKAKDEARCRKAILQAEKDIELGYIERHRGVCDLHRVIMHELIKNPSNRILEALSGKIEKWLDDDLEERQRELWSI